MKQKSFLKSKINWAAIILILQSLIPLLEQQPANMAWNNWVSLILGILIIIFRTYFTTTTIKAKTKTKTKTKTKAKAKRING